MKRIIGAIAGDIIGSIYEGSANQIKTTVFPLFKDNCIFTDDTVLTIATMAAILDDRDYTRFYQYFGERYPGRGYGGSFRIWKAMDKPAPYNSWGNGSAMRVSPIGWVYDTIEETLSEGKRSAEVTHNHREGIKGAQAIAAAVFLSRKGSTKEHIREFIETRFGYELHRTIEEIRPQYKFDVSCQGSVPESIIAFLDSNDFESTIRLAISLGGDSDTLACMAGSIAEAYYAEVSDEVNVEIARHLPEEMLNIIDLFSEKYLRYA